MRKVNKKSVKQQQSSDTSKEDEALDLEDTDCDIEENEGECMFYNSLLSEVRSDEQLIQCSKCFNWAHSDSTKRYIHMCFQHFRGFFFKFVSQLSLGKSSLPS